MKLNVLIFKNKDLGCFTTPVFDDHAPEDAAVQLGRAIKKSCLDGEADKFKAYKGLEMYCIGKFDDVTGELQACEATKLLDCDEAFKGGEK